MPPKSKGAGDKNLKSKSPAEFFQDNKGIAGFENAGKSLYTTLREFIENSLDSAEGIGVLPDVDISVEEVTLSQYEDLIGLKTHVRKDSALYADIETDKEKQKRLKDEAKAAAKAAKGGKADAGGGGKRGGAKAFFRVTVKDNGKGMAHDDIPNMLGREASSGSGPRWRSSGVSRPPVCPSRSSARSPSQSSLRGTSSTSTWRRTNPTCTARRRRRTIPRGTAPSSVSSSRVTGPRTGTRC
jgi:hypothetical protein